MSSCLCKICLEIENGSLSAEPCSWWWQFAGSVPGTCHRSSWASIPSIIHGQPRWEQNICWHVVRQTKHWRCAVTMAAGVVRLIVWMAHMTVVRQRNRALLLRTFQNNANLDSLTHVWVCVCRWDSLRLFLRLTTVTSEMVWLFALL